MGEPTTTDRETPTARRWWRGEPLVLPPGTRREKLVIALGLLALVALPVVWFFYAALAPRVFDHPEWHADHLLEPITGPIPPRYEEAYAYADSGFMANVSVFFKLRFVGLTRDQTITFVAERLAEHREQHPTFEFKLEGAADNWYGALWSPDWWPRATPHRRLTRISYKRGTTVELLVDEDGTLYGRQWTPD